MTDKENLKMGLEEISDFFFEMYQIAGGYVNLTIPMPKGTSISISSQSNVQDMVFDWYAFNF